MALPRSSLTSSLALNARVVRYAKSKISTVAVVFAKAAILQLTRRFPAKNSLKSGETTLPQGQNRRAQRLHDQRQAPVRGCFTSRHHHLQGHFSSTKLPGLIEVAQNPVLRELRNRWTALCRISNLITKASTRKVPVFGKFDGSGASGSAGRGR